YKTYLRLFGLNFLESFVSKLYAGLSNIRKIENKKFKQGWQSSQEKDFTTITQKRYEKIVSDLGFKVDIQEFWLNFFLPRMEKSYRVLKITKKLSNICIRYFKLNGMYYKILAKKQGN
ncbi:hypothetical protein KKC59_01785, partial [bacterium]|nr:hypothetical protein [bacterium]